MMVFKMEKEATNESMVGKSLSKRLPINFRLLVTYVWHIGNHIVRYYEYRNLNHCRCNYPGPN